MGLWKPTRRAVLSAGAGLIACRAIIDRAHAACGTPITLTGAGCGAPGGAVVHDGIAATRGAISTILLPSTHQANSCSAHYARSNISQFRILFPNFYSTGTTSGELAPGAATTITASYEYPAGTRTQVTFSGVATGAIPDGGWLLSDLMTHSILTPCGERLRINVFRQNSAGLVVNATNFFSDIYMGDRFDPGAVDLTMTGEIPNTQSVGYYPIVIAPISIPSVCIFGDSIAAGFSDTIDISGDVGLIARTIGPDFGYYNGGISGEDTVTFAGSSTQRRSVLQYCTHVITEHGGVDLFNGDTAATLEGHLSAIYALFGSTPAFQTTIAPRTTSTDGWITTGNQAPEAMEAQRVVFNNALRSSFGPSSGHFDTATALESALNSGLWVPHETDDGIHPNHSGYLLAEASGAIDTSRIGSAAPLGPDTGSAWGDIGPSLALSATRRANDTVTSNVAFSFTTARGAGSRNSGLVYFEIEIISLSKGTVSFGLIDGTTAAGSFNDFIGNIPNSYGHFNSTGNASATSPFTGTNLGAAYGVNAGDVFGVVADFTNKFAYLARNHTWFLSGDPTSGASGTGHVVSWTGSPTLFPGISFFNSDIVARLRTNNFLYAPPAGAGAWG